MIFSTREEAGRRLAELLEAYRGAPETVIVALPRGGVPVAAAMAEVLGLPLDIFFVKKIPSPYNEEAGIGAVSETGLMQVDSQAVEMLGVNDEYLQRRAQEKLEQMHRKRELYGRPRSDYRGKTVILTDDGIATGSSMLLAAEALRREGAKRVIIAVPVAPSELLPILEKVADEVYVLHPSDNLIAVGRFYRDFHQLNDSEVLDLLARAPRL
ncbi:phosphoribosyltransferase family protein [Nitratifractor sp.]|uniref:phosphoribosyltransferase n=1 Tax=Nitratifractor sp. TaxID=2268144 RepID=UPI0025DA5FDD|nr:phosphoribosyltransferase family protein [Nitratifractor sp.]